MARIFVAAGSGGAERVLVRPRTKVERAKLSYLEERGWVQHDNRYHGAYNTESGSWLGCLQFDGQEWSYSVKSPPAAVLKGRHGACFTHVGDSWFTVHFRRGPANLSDAVMAIESVLQNPDK